MQRSAWLLVLLSTVLLYTGSVSAHTALFPNQAGHRHDAGAVRLSLPVVIEHSLQHNPRLKFIDAVQANKLAQAFEATVLDNPTLQLDAHFEDGEGQPNWSIELEQPLHLFGDHRRYAAALTQVATVEQQVDVLQALNAVVRLYYDYWLLQQREDFLHLSEHQMQVISHQVEHASQSGEVAANEAAIFQADALRISEELRTIQVKKSHYLTELLQVTGLEWQAMTLADPALAPIPADLQTLLAFAQTRSNVKQVLLARQRLAETRYRRAKRDSYLSEISPRLLYDHDAENDIDSIGLGLALDIPLWNRNQAERQQSQSELVSATAELATIERLTLEKLIETRHQQALSAQQSMWNYRDKIFPAYRHSYDVVYTMFEAGQASMLQLWTVRDTLHDIQEATLAAVREALETRLALELVMGGKLEEIE